MGVIKLELLADAFYGSEIVQVVNVESTMWNFTMGPLRFWTRFA